jgi:hypothetical protein
MLSQFLKDGVDASKGGNAASTREGFQLFQDPITVVRPYR